MVALRRRDAGRGSEKCDGEHDRSAAFVWIARCGGCGRVDRRRLVFQREMRALAIVAATHSVRLLSASSRPKNSISSKATPWPGLQ